MEMAATIMTFHLLGRYLEAKAKGIASQAIRKLLTLGAKTAPVERDDQEQEVPRARRPSRRQGSGYRRSASRCAPGRQGGCDPCTTDH